MTETVARQNNGNLAGILWMVAAMGVFAIEDALVKAAAAHLPVAEVLVLFGLGGACLFAVAAAIGREPVFGADILSRPMRVRACFEVTARLFYVLALALTPLSATTAILQTRRSSSCSERRFCSVKRSAGGDGSLFSSASPVCWSCCGLERRAFQRFPCWP